MYLLKYIIVNDLKLCLLTGKPQFGHGQLSVFVPHLGQVMVTASILLIVNSQRVTAGHFDDLTGQHPCLLA